MGHPLSRFEQNELLTVTVIDGEISLKDQMKEYTDRGSDLAEYSYLDFFLETYNGLPYVSSKNSNRASARSEYITGSGRGKNCRVIRADGHETLPLFIGKWFPRRDSADERELYCAFMLALLLPWRDIRDIHIDDETFDDTFRRLEESANKRTKDIIKNANFFYECSDGAAKRKEQNGKGRPIIEIEDAIHDEDITSAVVHLGPQHVFTQQDVETALLRQFSQDERLYGAVGMTIANEVGFFKDDVDSVPIKEIAIPATREEGIQFLEWEATVRQIRKGDGICQQFVDGIPEDGVNTDDTGGYVTEAESPRVDAMNGGKSDTSAHLEFLNKEQLRAHDIVSRHLHAHLDGRKPGQLLMIVTGPGGTGKSTMLEAISKTFELEGASHLLYKSAMSGVAASLIGGTTLHWWGGLPVMSTPQKDDWSEGTSKDVKERRLRNMELSQWLTIDEASMMTTDVLTISSQASFFQKSMIGGLGTMTNDVLNFRFFLAGSRASKDW